MNAGRIAVAVIVLTSILAAAGFWWLQVYAFYEPVKFTPGQEVMLVPVAGEVPEPILAEDVTGIDADSSPLRYRACFTTPMSVAMLTETYRIYDKPTPLYGPSWFDCFDADRIGEALERGEAVAFLSGHLAAYGIDRVAAVFPDGRGYVWNQINDCGQAYYDERKLPDGCPTPPERSK